MRVGREAVRAQNAPGDQPPPVRRGRDQRPEAGARKTRGRRAGVRGEGDRGDVPVVSHSRATASTEGSRADFATPRDPRARVGEPINAKRRAERCGRGTTSSDVMPMRDGMRARRPRRVGCGVLRQTCAAFERFRDGSLQPRVGESCSSYDVRWLDNREPTRRPPPLAGPSSSSSSSLRPGSLLLSLHLFFFFTGLSSSPARSSSSASSRAFFFFFFLAFSPPPPPRRARAPVPERPTRTHSAPVS